LPTYRHAEISMSSNELDRYSLEDGLWYNYEIPPQVDDLYTAVLKFAQSVCTEKQYMVLFLISRGLTHQHTSLVFGTSRQNITEIFGRAIKNLKKSIKKHLPYGVIVDGYEVNLEDFVKESNKTICNICGKEIKPGCDIVFDKDERTIAHKSCSDNEMEEAGSQNKMELTLGR